MRDILTILEQNAKATPEEISEMTGHTPEEVKDTIAQAERDRTIVKYKAIINWDRAGKEEVMALVEVRSLHLMSGGYDLSVLLVGSTMQELASFVTMKLAVLEEVQGTTTHFLLKRFKEDGVILDGEDVVKRLPLTP